jgi:hypothetical protein
MGAGLNGSRIFAMMSQMESAYGKIYLKYGVES